MSVFDRIESGTNLMYKFQVLLSYKREHQKSKL